MEAIDQPKTHFERWRDLQGMNSPERHDLVAELLQQAYIAGAVGLEIGTTATDVQQRRMQAHLVGDVALKARLYAKHKGFIL